MDFSKLLAMFGGMGGGSAGGGANPLSGLMGGASGGSGGGMLGGLMGGGKEDSGPSFAQKMLTPVQGSQAETDENAAAKFQQLQSMFRAK